MEYSIQLKPRAIKDLKGIQLSDRKRIAGKIDLLADGLQGDVKKLTNHNPEYRARAGSYRILFEVEETEIIIYRI